MSHKLPQFSSLSENIAGCAVKRSVAGLYSSLEDAMMKEGFYWVQLGTDEPEVWFFSGEQADAWFEPTKNESIGQQKFADLGYKVIGERLSLP